MPEAPMPEAPMFETPSAPAPEPTDLRRINPTWRLTWRLTHAPCLTCLAGSDDHPRDGAGGRFRQVCSRGRCLASAAMTPTRRLSQGNLP